MSEADAAADGGAPRELPLPGEEADTSAASAFPDEIKLSAPSDLSKEFRRVSEFLSDLESPWNTRIAAMQRLQAVLSAPGAASLPNLTAELDAFKECLATQIADRRSKVVKEASGTAAVIMRVSMEGRAQAGSADDGGEERRTLVGVAVHLVRAFFFTLPQSVKVISEAGRSGVAKILEFTRDDADHTMLRALAAGVAEKHAPVRATCLEGCSVMLAKRRTATPDGPRAEPLPEAAAGVVEEAAAAGLADSDAAARKMARLLVAELSVASPETAARLVAALTPSAARMYERERAAHLRLGGDGAAAAAKPKRRSALPAGRRRIRGRGRGGGGARGGGRGGGMVIEVSVSRKARGAASAAPSAAAAADAGASGTDAAAKPSSPVGPLPPVAPGDEDPTHGTGVVRIPSPRKGHRRGASSASPHGSTGGAWGGGEGPVSPVPSPFLRPGSLHRGSSKDMTDAVLDGSDGWAAIAGRARSSSVDSVAYPAAGAAAGRRGSIVARQGGATSSSSGTVLLEEASGPRQDPAPAAAAAAAPAAASAAAAAAAPKPPRPASGARQRKRFALLSKLLDLEDPQVTPKMVDFLLQDGVMDTMLGFISRLSADEARALAASEAAAAADAAARPSEAPSFKAPRPRPTAEVDAVAVRRSHQAMRLLREQNSALPAVLQRTLEPTVLHLLTVFHPSSRGNFYHACQVLSQVVRWFPAKTLAVVLTPGGSALFRHAFGNLHEPPVGDAVLDVLCAAAPPAGDAAFATGAAVEGLLERWQVPRTLSRRICDMSTSESAASSSVAFLTQLLDRCGLQERARVLAVECVTGGGRLVASLEEAATNPREGVASWQRLMVAEMLATVLRRASAPDNRFGLAAALPRALEVLVPRVPHLCHALLGAAPLTADASAADRVTPLRLALADSLAALAAASPEAAAAVTGDAWEALSRWLFRQPNHSLFMARFRELLVGLLRAADAGGEADATLAAVLGGEVALLRRLVEFRQKPRARPCSLQAVAVELCNHARLTAARRPGGGAAAAIGALPAWNAFLPDLLAESKLQAGGGGADAGDDAVGPGSEFARRLGYV